jgi:HlyD family secretion protein
VGEARRLQCALCRVQGEIIVLLPAVRCRALCYQRARALGIVAPPAARPTLADGYRVDARVVVATLDNAVVVPVGVLFRDRDGWAVFAVVDGVARRRTVVLSQRAETTAAVQQGLEPGDTVILFPTDAIAEGVRVRPR